MKPEFDYNSLPYDFIHCLNARCKRADECLRRQATLRMPKERGTVTVVNPGHIVSTGKNCPYFKPDKPLLYALGMTRLLDAVPHSEAMMIKQQMIDYFGQNNYYRFKRKERLFSPEEQEYVRGLFQERGLTDLPVFDEFIERYE